MSVLDPTAPARAVEAVRNVDGRQATAMAAEVAAGNETIAFLEEAMADLELMLEDRGWQELGFWGDLQFSRRGLQQSSRLCRVMAVANPLIKRGVNLRIQYIWGGGVTIAARAAGGNDGEQDVNAVVQGFLDDAAVVQRLTGAQAHETNERTLATDGNLFAALFTNPRTGRVQPRVIPLDEINRVIKNPEDRSEAWLYQRISLDAAGNQVITYHPDIDYQPRMRVLRIGDNASLSGEALEAGDILWDAPIIHLKVNALADWDFGIGDAFSAIAWARGYKEFLEDWAKLVKALSRFAWRVTSDRPGAAARAAARIGQRTTLPSSDTGEAGATVAMVGANLEAIPKTGATIDSGSGRPLAAMIAAGLDVPVTMLLADPGVTGARATAETLDTPTENMAALRQQAWAWFFRRICDYVIDQAVQAPQGALTGAVARDEWDRLVVTLDGDTKRTIDINFPDLSDTPIDLLMQAIVGADGIDKLPPLLIVKLVLDAFNVSDVDEWLAQVTDEDGNFKAPAGAAGQAAADAFRAGQDPAAL